LQNHIHIEIYKLEEQVKEKGYSFGRVRFLAHRMLLGAERTEQQS